MVGNEKIKVTDPAHPMAGQVLTVVLTEQSRSAVVAHNGNGKIRYWLTVEQFEPVSTPARWRVSFFFAWYDLWIGAFYDRKQRTLYLCPLPCFVVKVELGAADA